MKQQVGCDANNVILQFAKYEEDRAQLLQVIEESDVDELRPRDAFVRDLERCFGEVTPWEFDLVSSCLQSMPMGERPVHEYTVDADRH